MEAHGARHLNTPWYGSRQMARCLQRQGYAVGRKRVRRLMRLMGLRALALERYGRPEIFNSDQASRFTSGEWTERLKAEGMQYPNELGRDRPWHAAKRATRDFDGCE